MGYEEVYVARQPIFNRKQNVVAYELLFRSGFTNAYEALDGDQATTDVINNSFLLLGMETLTGGKRAFVNFTANSIINNIPSLLPPEMIVVEILEDVFPDANIIDACKKLKSKGYLLVLDDFVFQPVYEPLIELADIIKVDFLSTSRKERLELIQRLQKYPVKFLAEKVETHEEFQLALQDGFSYFQGFFFSKPLVMSCKSLPEYKVNHLHILQEINRPELEFNKIEDIIKRDVSLSYKLLKFINSPMFGFRNRISSLRQALTLLGQIELTKWISLIALKNVATDKPGELILGSLIRARFAETLASVTMPHQKAANAFLMGLFSHIDALLDRSLQDILEEISLEEEIKQALLEKEHNQFYLLYKLIKSYEAGEWEVHSSYVGELGIQERDVLKAYRDSLRWAHDLLMVS
ncbi:EAL and HDOD domain-containing protein [Sporomusa sp. KB1]|jgi:EAL and modified HD-GYP domain-containing signal transduction protein|uniref:EAL and HDOD domain-containing protein n=1 Tax=Sporomusa sp. KB1 TaxID=943346 RepID=UPI0011AD9256|nr:HDOD domain-containing protein [Sporomusa sp. KB1]TWH45873.1 EAL and modified HD-GYP domain-containing signal transduction protein [Sporomusa sp. KB1]